jgi:hypothetical protein
MWKFTSLFRLSFLNFTKLNKTLHGNTLYNKLVIFHHIGAEIFGNGFFIYRAIHIF